jgi:hypothetical protein
MVFSTTDTVTLYSSLFQLLVDLEYNDMHKFSIFLIFNTTFGVGDVYL